MIGDEPDRRGQSAIIGVVLLLLVTVIGITAVAAGGATVLGNAQADSQVAQAGNSMSQMSSKAGLVALGRSETHTFDLGDLGDGTVEVREGAGTVTVTHVDGGRTGTCCTRDPMERSSRRLVEPRSPIRAAASGRRTAIGA